MLIQFHAMGTSQSTAPRSASVRGSTAQNIHSENGLADLAAGDIIYRPLPGVVGFANYCHYGVYVGRNEVIHFTEYKRKGKLEKVSLEDFADEREVDIQRDFSYPRRSKRDTAMKALEIYNLEEDGWTTYNAMSKNCEHFANYCATSVKYSKQTNSNGLVN